MESVLPRRFEGVFSIEYSLKIGLVLNIRIPCG